MPIKHTLFQPYHNFAKGHPVEDLIQCGRKLDLLLTTLGLKKNQPVSVLHKVDNEKVRKPNKSFQITTVTLILGQEHPNKQYRP